MKAYQAANVASTSSWTVLGLTLTKHVDRYGTRETRWEVSDPGQWVISLATISEALALIWARTEGGAA